MSEESIVKATFRSLCKSFATIIGIGLAIALIVMVLGSMSEQGPIYDKTSAFLAIDGKGNRKLLPPSSPVILKINIKGVIGSRELNAQRVEAQLADSHSGFLKKERVKAVLLYIDSPGGGVTDSFNIYQSLVEYKEKYNVPMYAFVDGMCASGGMMIACAADQIYASPMSLIGSVGVRFGPNFNLSELMQKVGIAQKTLTRGKDKDMLNPFRPWQVGEDQSLENLLTYDYRIFVDIVTSARKNLSREKLITEYGAQVFDPIKAKGLGYIDQSGMNYKKTLEALAKAANFSEDVPYQVVELRVQQPLFSELVEGKSPLVSGTLNHKFSLLDLPKLPRPLYLYDPTPPNS